MRHRRLTALALATAAALGTAGPAHAGVSACPSAATTPQSANVDQVERTVLCLVNRERSSHGLQRLQASGKLARAAVKHSQDMVRRDFFDHESPGGGTMTQRIRSAGWISGARSYAFAENIAWGTGALSSPQSIVRSWMRSPGHRRNILNGRYDELGVGIALGAPGRDGGATFTGDFGARG